MFFMTPNKNCFLSNMIIGRIPCLHIYVWLLMFTATWQYVVIDATQILKRKSICCLPKTKMKKTQERKKKTELNALIWLYNRKQWNALKTICPCPCLIKMIVVWKYLPVFFFNIIIIGLFIQTWFESGYVLSFSFKLIFEMLYS